MVLDRTAYDRGILKIINDTSKFKALGNDPTLNQEGKLRRFLRDLKKKGHLDQELYDAIYPSGSQPGSFSERKHSDTIMSAHAEVLRKNTTFQISPSLTKFNQI